jgi:serine/threonine-protein kinase
LEEALPIALQIAEALEDAHEKGIIHRDLKPANIKLTTEGKVKVLDFGLAKALEEERSAGDISNSPTLTMQATQAGIILGTAAYMAPEQARGRPVDRRADIWSFGVVLFEMLAGEKAYQGEDLSLTLANVMTKAPKWESLPSSIPGVIRRLLERCLGKDPRIRLRDIGEARIAIDEYLDNPIEEEISPTRPTTAKIGRSQGLFWGGVLLVALSAVGLSGWLLKPQPPAPTPERLEANVSGEQPLFTQWGNPVALSPNGKLLAFVAGTNVESHLYLRSLERLESALLPGTELPYAPFFSPDGLWLGFFEGSEGSGGGAGGELKKVSISGGTPLMLCPVGRTLGATWGAEGTIVFAQASSGLMKAPVAGGTPEELTRIEEGETLHAWPQFLPGGFQVLFVSYASDGSHIEVVEVQTGKRKVIYKGGRYPRYAASGHLLYVDSGTLYAAPFDLQGLEVTAEAAPVLQEVRMGSFAQGIAHYEVSPDGTLVYLRGTGPLAEHALAWVDEEGTVTPASKNHLRGAISFPRLSPDGQRLAVTNSLNENRDIWVVDLERDLQTRLTSEEAVDSNPVWSPDGSSIYFQSIRGGRYGIFRKPADGSGEAELLLESDKPLGLRDASWDGEFLAYCPTGTGTSTDIFLLPLEGDPSPESFVATIAAEGSPRFSPDGRWMAYDSNETGRFEVYIRSFPGPGGKFQVSGEGGFRPQWSQDGQRVFYRTDDAIWVNTVGGQGEVPQVGRARRLVDLEDDYNRSLVVAPDEKRFLLFRNEQTQTGGSSQLTFVFHWFEELKRLVPSE